MQRSRVLIHRGGRLRAPVADRAVEIQGGDRVRAQRTAECDAAVHRFGGVIPHKSIVVLSPAAASGCWVRDLRVRTPPPSTAWAGSSALISQTLSSRAKSRDLVFSFGRLFYRP